MHLTNEVLVISGLMVLAILFLMTMFARLYRKPLEYFAESRRR